MIEMLVANTLQSLSIEALGFAAGTIISLSAVPQIVRNQTLWAEAARQSALRNALLVIGNLLWTIYGANKSAPAIIAMCTLGAILNFIVLLQVCRARRCRRGPS